MPQARTRYVERAAGSSHALEFREEHPESRTVRASLEVGKRAPSRGMKSRPSGPAHSAPPGRSMIAHGGSQDIDISSAASSA